MRIVWIIAGGLALALGVAGIVLPLVPTTPLLLLAAFCFARSSPRLEMWLVEHPRLGPPIRDWRAEGAISVRGKTLALVVIGATFALSLILRLPAHVLLIQAATLGAVSLFILTRPVPRAPTTPPDPRQP
ncbi:YbaN family protein [Pararhodobacter sp.]